MPLSDAVAVALLFAAIASMIVTIVYERSIRQLQRENRMLRRLLSEQAKLHQMSLDAYISMSYEAYRHSGR